jgi:hypothetical protein
MLLSTIFESIYVDTGFDCYLDFKHKAKNIEELLKIAKCPHDNCRNGILYKGNVGYGGDLSYGDCLWCKARKEALELH